MRKMTRKAVRPQDQTVYEKYKNLVYRYLRKLYPEAEESLQRRILGRVWDEAGRLDILSGTEDERKVLTALLIYLPGKFGVRIEDVLIYTEEGNVNLTKSPKELIIL